MKLETDRSMYRIEFTDDNGDRRRQKGDGVVVVEDSSSEVTGAREE